MSAAVLPPNPVPAEAPIVPHHTSPWFGRLLTVGLIVVVGIAFLQPWKAVHSEPVSNGRDQATANVKQVQVAQPTAATNSNVVLPATVRPWQTTALHARVSGYLTKWHRDLGEQVKAGELLAEIETPELDQELAEGEALASEAAAAAIQARAERQEAEAELKVTEAQAVRIRADAELAVLQLGRRERLLTTAAISQEEFDTFQKQVEARNADVVAAEADVARRRTNLETRTAVITAREATAKSRLANVERLKELQAFKKIVAPFDGVVTRRSAEVGMLVTAGAESLFTVEDMSRVRVQVNVPQTYALQTVRGVAATVSLPESSAQAVVGTVTRTASSVESTTRTMTAEIELDNAERKLQPGSYVQVTLTVPQRGAAWTIPTNTVQMQVGGPHVAVVNDKNEIEVKRVTLGRDLGNRVIVQEGVSGKERLVVNPGDDLRDGQSVAVEAREAATMAQR